MALTSEQIENVVRANAAALGIHLAAEHWPGVCRYFALSAAMAEQVQGLPLGVHDESGSVFVPLGPEGEP